MKKIISILLVLLSLLTFSCVKRTTISDGELALIFRDAFLANAYILDKDVKFDTLQVYQPIFDKYGYSADDVAYTVGSFSKRKSARLSDVVERAIKLLEDSLKYYKLETTIIDTIENIATRRATRTIYRDERVEFYSLADSTKLQITLYDLEPGDYRLRFDYEVDSLDDNRSSYRSLTWIERPDTVAKFGLTTNYLRRRNSSDYDREFTFDTLTPNFNILLAETFEVKRKPHITFSEITFEYTPPVEQAVEEFYRQKLDLRIFANDFFHSFSPTDSLELPAL